MANNMCSMCGDRSGGSYMGPNYAKLVDPPIRQYGSFMEINDSSEKNHRKSVPCDGGQVQMCLPALIGRPPPSTGYQAPGQRSSIINVPIEAARPCPKFVCESCPPPPPTKIWLIKSSPVPQKSACLPVGNSNQGCSTAKLMICLPCPPPNMALSAVPQIDRKQVASFPFAVPQKLEGEMSCQKAAGKYLPPPERKICTPNCIHVTDIKEIRPCTWHQNIPCVAHCFNTPLSYNVVTPKKNGQRDFGSCHMVM